MNRETEEKSEQIEVDFKTTLFASNPELFHKIYSVENDQEEFDIEEIVPESEDDVHKLMAQLKREGVIN